MLEHALYTDADEAGISGAAATTGAGTWTVAGIDSDKKSMSSGSGALLDSAGAALVTLVRGGVGFLSSMECNFSFAKHHIIKLVAHSVPPGYSNGMEQRRDRKSVV